MKANCKSLTYLEFAADPAVFGRTYMRLAREAGFTKMIVLETDGYGRNVIMHPNEDEGAVETTYYLDHFNEGFIDVLTSEERNNIYPDDYPRDKLWNNKDDFCFFCKPKYITIN